MTGIERFVERHRLLGVDTNVLIALIEQRADYHRTAGRVFAAIQRFQPAVFFSVVTVPELLIQPLRLKQPELAKEYERLLINGPGSLAPIDSEVALRAAELGGKYRLRTLDALIVASLLEQQVTGFVTADRAFARVQELDVHVLTGRRRRTPRAQGATPA